jgi:2-keto-3-deoxy-L-rhamnonate aldolase RhmA
LRWWPAELMTAEGRHGGQGMQINQTKAKIRAGQPAFGAFVGLPAPNVVELLGWARLDFAVI